MAEEQVGKYKVLKELGKGSMGLVYLAEDPEIGRQVAIKTLRSVYLGEDAAGQEALQRFRQESRSAGKLKHPNIVTIFEAGRSKEGSPYIVMEYIDGMSLDELISEQRQFEPLEALHLLAQVGSAIDYAHSFEIIHRDIKPSNVILDGARKPYLLDFGVAKLSDTSLTPAGTVVGTPSYMAPEQIRGDALTGATDRFAFAVLAYEMLVGTRPFPGTDFMSVASNIVHQPPLSFEKTGTTLDSKFEPVLQKALSKDQNARYQSCLSFVKALAEPFDIPVDHTGVLGYQQGLTLHSLTSRLGGLTASSSPKISSGGMSDENKADLQATVVGRPIIATPVPALQPASSAPSIASREAQSSSQAVSPERAISSGANSSGIKEGQGGVAAIIGAAVFLFAIAGLVFLFLGRDSDENLAVTSPEVEASAPEKVAAKNNDGSAVQANTPGHGNTPAFMNSVYAPGCQLGAECSVSSAPAVAKVLEADKAETQSVVPVSAAESELLAKLSKASSSEEELIDAIGRASTLSYETAAPKLLTLIAHPRYKVRIAVLKLFTSDKQYRTREVFRGIVDRLEDDEFLVRGFSAKFIASLNNEAGRKILSAHLARESHPAVKKVIEAALQK